MRQYAGVVEQFVARRFGLVGHVQESLIEELQRLLGGDAEELPRLHADVWSNPRAGFLCAKVPRIVASQRLQCRFDDTRRVRSHRKRGDDNRVFAARGSRQDMTSELKTKAGLEDVVVGTSAICYLDGDRGVLAYRGYDIHDLATQRDASRRSATCCGTAACRAAPSLVTCRSQLAAARALPEP